MKMRKLGAFFYSCLFGATSYYMSAQNYNYGEALQKSLLFYETQQSGKLPSWNRISWRDDAGVNDGKDVGLDLTGGWHDAGDHIKFGFPMAFTVTALNWGYLEYKEGYDKARQTEVFKRNVKWVTDYFIKCHPSPNEFYAQVSEKSQDHNFWMSPEMVDVHPLYGERQSFKLSTSKPGTEVACETAAALASASMIFKDSDPAYSATLLRHAKELYDFGDKYRGKYNEEGGIPATGTYSSGGYQDELTWGALWLYKATGEKKYLDKAIAEYTQPDFLWSIVWDDKSYGNMVLLSIITGEDTYKADAERHLDFWQKGGGISYSPGGQAHLTQWGSLRHSMNASLTALIYSDRVDTPKKKTYHDFAVDQVRYALGDNPNNRSLVTGFGVNPPTKPHHRGQHASWTRSENIPEESRHTLWGALIGGPGKSDDFFVENRSDFQANEVAVDYNACYQGVLARMVMEFGGSPLADFPQPEKPGVEFLNEVKINSESGTFTEVAIWLNNRSAWPARVPGSLSARYFVNLSETIAAGIDPSDIQITARGAGKAVGGLKVWNAAQNIYYVEVTVDQGKMPFPGGQGEYRQEIQMRVGLPNNSDASAWNPNNDFSYEGLSSGLQIVDNVPIYADGKLVGGKEPGGSTNPTPVNTAPVAAISADKVSGEAPLQVSFDASGSTDAEGDALTYAWNFGNGETSTEVDPLITFNTPGSYLVTLTVSDGKLASEEVSTSITVSEETPTPVEVDGGTITGGPFEFTVGDGIADNATGITVSGSKGPNSQWVVTDEDSNILGLPANIEDVDFDGAGEGVCLIWYMRYAGELEGAAVGSNANDIEGNFDLSNSIRVVRNASTTNPPTPIEVDGGTITGGPFEFTVGDGIADTATGITITGSKGPNRTWVVTDEEANILGLPANIEDVDFDGAGEGVCLIWYMRYSGELEGAAVGSNANDIKGNFDLSNSIRVVRTLEVVAPPTGGGDCSFGTPLAQAFPTTSVYLTKAYVLGDNGPDLSNVTGFSLNWDLDNNGLWNIAMATNNGTPNWYVDLGSKVEFKLNVAQPEITFTGTGFAGFDGSYYVAKDGDNIALVSKTGGFTVYFSNSDTAPDCGDGPTTPAPVEVDGGTIAGGPFEFTVGDGVADNATGITVSGSKGPNSQWVVTDEDANILGLPANIEDVDFDGAGEGICLIWYMRYAGDLEGAAVGSNANDIKGNFDLSNSIRVVRTTDTTNPPAPIEVDGGEVSTATNLTEVTTITGDGIADLISFQTTSTATEDYSYIITDDKGNILVVEEGSHDFEGASVGICRVYGISYQGELSVGGKNIADAGLATGEYEVSSNAIVVNRTEKTDPNPNPPTGGGSDNEYVNRFIELREELYDPENGYFSKDGSPHHSIETLLVEAPDYGHESTSELYSYWIMLEAMNGRITKDWKPLADVWAATEKFIIPTKADQPTNAAYNASSPAAYASEFDLPSQYPAPLNFNAGVGQDPVSNELSAAYGPEVYQMHWLLDNDNFYGYGNRGDGVSTPSYINTFQRGAEESVYETVPHPSWESFNWGSSNGFLPIFIEDQNYAKQWRYTSAPDADARAVQAMYWAVQYAKEQGGTISNDLMGKTVKMGDYLRLAMFDKYFKQIGAQSETGGAATGYDSAHYLMSWYMSWGGSADPASAWAFRISSSHCHFGYQNPIAAYAMSEISEFAPKTPNGKNDWAKSLDRQMELYQYLQSKEGAIAGGVTNSWNGNYSKYPAGKSTFYDMAFDTNPVYHDPGSGTWFGWQAWSMERVAEYYYITNDPVAKQLMDKWTTWVESEVKLIGSDDFEIPATLEWSGEPDTWNPSSPGANSGLSVTVTDYGRDLGVAASAAKALIYYAAATEKYGTLDQGAKTLAKEILDRMWVTYRDDKGVSAPEQRGDYGRIFNEEVFIPSGFSGKMPNGDEIKPGVTFLDIRSDLKNDPEYANVKAAVDAGEDYEIRYHRSWAQIEVALANAEYGFFFGDEKEPGKKGAEIAFITSISPNPVTQGYFTINSNLDLDGAVVTIVDIVGKVVDKEVISGSTQSARVSTSGLPTGMYLVQMNTVDGKVAKTEKLIIR